MAIRKHAPLTSPKIKNLAAKALASPSRLTTEETRELAGSVLAHIENSVEQKVETAQKKTSKPAPTPASASKPVAKKAAAKKPASKKPAVKKTAGNDIEEPSKEG